MTDQQADGILWLAFVQAEDRRDHAPGRDHARLWRRRLLRTIDRLAIKGKVEHA